MKPITQNDRRRFPNRWVGPWHIVNTRTDESLESHETESRAAYWCASINEHEQKQAAERAANPSIERRETEAYVVRYEAA